MIETSQILTNMVYNIGNVWCFLIILKSILALEYSHNSDLA